MKLLDGALEGRQSPPRNDVSDEMALFIDRIKVAANKKRVE